MTCIKQSLIWKGGLTWIPEDEIARSHLPQDVTILVNKVKKTEDRGTEIRLKCIEPKSRVGLLSNIPSWWLWKSDMLFKKPVRNPACALP